MLDEPAVFLRRTRQEARHVDERDDRNIEAVAEAHEARRLARRIAVEHAREHHRLVRDDADGAAFHAREAGHDVLRERFLDFEEVGFVDDFEDQLLDVVRLVRIVRNERVERMVDALGLVFRRNFRNARLVARRQEIHQAAHLQKRLDVVLVGAIGDRRFRRVDLGAAKFFRRHRFVRHGLHDVGTGHEHVARVFDHEDEIGHRGRVDVAARARSHDDGNLRNDAGGQNVALEHFAIAAEGVDAFLNARAARIEQTDDRRAVLQSHVLDFGDLLGVRFAQRSAHHGEVLGEDIDRAPVDGAPTGHDAIARNLGLFHAELGATVLDEHVELLERALVHHQLDAFAGRQLALLVLRVDTGLAAAQTSIRAPRLKLPDDVFHEIATLPCRDECAGSLARPRESANVEKSASSAGRAGRPLIPESCRMWGLR